MLGSTVEMIQVYRALRKPFALADGLHMPVPNAYATSRRDNSREGGEGIPDQFDQSRMKVGAQSFRDVSKDRTDKNP